MSDGIPIKKEDIYSTVEQRILGGENFVEKIKETHCLNVLKKRRKRAYGLTEIASIIEGRTGSGPDRLRGRSKDRRISAARKVFSLVAREYGHGVQEIATYLRKDGALISRYSREAENFKEEMDEVIRTLDPQNVNNHV